MAEDMNFAHGSERNDYKWTDIAFDLVSDGKLIVSLTGPAGDRVIAGGNCPRCNHEVEYAFDETIVVPQGSSRTLSRDTTPPPSGTGTARTNGAADPVHYVTVAVLCQCREPHPGGPPKSFGCGIIFNIDLPTP